MYIKFDSFKKREPLTLILCNPGSVYDPITGTPSKMVGILTNSSDEELCINFNSTSTLSFRLWSLDDTTIEHTDELKKLYDGVLNRRSVFVKGYGYFVITNVVVGMDEAGQHYKDVEATSVEVEIENKNIPYIEDGTYRFEALLETLVSDLPLWTIGDIPNSISTLYRSFEDVSTDLNILSFMLENMQDAYECIFLFDPIRRIINIYDQNDYLIRSDIHITKDDLVKSFEISEGSEDLYTALNVTGENGDTTVAGITPIGTSTLYRFDYYLSWMSEELAQAVKAWEGSVNSMMESESDFQKLVDNYYTSLTDTSIASSDMQAKKTLLDMYQRCHDNVVAEANDSDVGAYNDVIIENGGEAISTQTIKPSDPEYPSYIQNLISAIDGYIITAQENYDAAVEKYDELLAKTEAYKTSLESVRGTYAPKVYFSESQYAELLNYIYEGSYSDDYVVTTDTMSYIEKLDQARTMYQRAVGVLKKASEPTREYALNVDNFLFVKDFEFLTEDFSVGSVMNVELEDGSVDTLFLTNVTINYDDSTLSLTFGNRYNKYDTKSLFENVLGSVSKSANTIDYLKDTIYPIKNGGLESSVKEAVQIANNLTMASALTNTNEEVVIDGSGITSRNFNPDDGEYSPQQIKINGKTIVFTDDAWKSCATALGELVLDDGTTAYGLNTEVLIGKLLLGQKLQILNDDSTVVINENGIGMVADATSGDNKISFTIEREYVGSDNQVSREKVFYLDSDGNLVLNSSTKVADLSGTEVGLGELEDLTQTFSITGEGLDIMKVKPDGSPAEIYSHQTNESYEFRRTFEDGSEEAVMEITPSGVTELENRVTGELEIGDGTVENYVEQWAIRKGKNQTLNGSKYNLNIVWIGG